MFPIRDDVYSKETPIVTYSIAVLCMIVYLWDRAGHVMGPSMAFADWALRPDKVIDALTGRGDPTALVTFFTAMFLHGSLLHIIGNLIFLITFGCNAEHALGGPRFALYYVLWGIVAFAVQIFVMPGSPVPIVGASGAIGGVLGAYFLLFPSNRITFIVFPLFFLPLVIPAWITLGLWFVFQIFMPQEGVANWAHAGGFLAGMVTILILGGRQRVLQGAAFVREPEVTR